MDIIIKIITSFPVILIFLYFIPILGVILSIFRMMITKRRKILFPIILTIIGILIFIMDKYDLQEYITFINLFEYDILSYSKTLIILGIILIILSYIANKTISKIQNSIFKYINKLDNIEQEISKKNNMEIKLKQERAKNTHHVKCSSCGSDNLVSEKVGKCKYCRKNLVNKKYKD